MQRARLKSLLEQHHDSAYGWALHCCDGDRQEAQDVLHSAYVSVLTGKALFRGQSSLRTWLFAVIRNTALSGRRRLQRRIRLLGRVVFRPAKSPPEADDRLQQKELRERITGLLAHLSARQREVLQLVFYHDLSVAEAARVMGVTLGSARTHYQRGKERLRQQIEKTRWIDDYRLGRENQAIVSPDP